jgi:hypothetical protein
MISVQEFVDKIWESPLDSTIELPDELQRILENEGNNELEALSLVEKILPRVRQIILEKIQVCDRKRVTPNFRFSDYSNNRLVGILILQKEEQQKQKLRHRKELHTVINKLKWDRFEDLCVYTLTLIGFEKYSVGQRTQDGGLDFFGLYPMQIISSYGGFLTDLNLRVFGQAKHYNGSTVGAKEIHAFYCQFKEDFLYEKGRAYEHINLEAKWFLDARGPIVPMMITNGHFTRVAEEFAGRKGIIIREGSQIVEDIIQLSKTDIWLNAEKGKYIFDATKLETFLEIWGKDHIHIG